MKQLEIDSNEYAFASMLKNNYIDTEQEAVFDNITELAAYICDMPVAMISLSITRWNG